MPQRAAISRASCATNEVCDRRGGKLFLSLILLVLSVALFAIRPISEEEGNVGLLMEQFLYSYFGRFSGIEFGLVCVLVLIQLMPQAASGISCSRRVSSLLN
jgi:hypothetical protein